MPRVEWGKKVVCTNCETKFYDLNRKPAVCPSCGSEYVDPISTEVHNNTKRVFTDNVDTTVDNNIVGSDASESIAEVEDIDLEDAIDDETISLEDSDSDVSVMPEEVDDIDIVENPSDNIEQD
mgnify:CR=1 FL=1|tara:strand:- start:1722 stop:2090 length:369 start_codon:yes stop_codon:yes gene_type:complete